MKNSKVVSEWFRFAKMDLETTEKYLQLWSLNHWKLYAVMHNSQQK